VLLRALADMARINAGMFRVGADVHYPKERADHDVTVDAFLIDRHFVTNADFTAFVCATNCITFTERSLDPALYPVASCPVRPSDPRDWWEYVPRADWRHPRG
jgi:sulfatase modifying factor 1